jgi:hypothetical protein
MSKHGLWIMDVQEKLIPHINDFQSCVRGIQFSIDVAKCLGLPILVTEQSPESLGKTDPILHLPEGVECISKKTFSGMQSPKIAQFIEDSAVSCWWLCGIETHICVALTALDMRDQGYQVAVLGDAVGAHNPRRHQMGLQELKGKIIPVTHSETWAYGLMKSSEHPAFRDVVKLVKQRKGG